MRIKPRLHNLVKSNWFLFINAGSLIGTFGVTSVLGFLYWWVAAQLFPPAAVGLASAAIASMMLLGTAAMMGLGTLLMGELQHQQEKAASLISTALLVSGGVGLVFGAAYALITPWLSSDLGVLSATPVTVLLFAAGVSLTATTLVLDEALIGLLRGGLQLWRNTILAVAKLVVLVIAGLALTSGNGLIIYMTWVFGIVVSLIALTRFLMPRRAWRQALQPHWEMPGELGRTAGQHHVLNLAIKAPGLLLPVIVTAVHSAELNASFYIAWMLAVFVFVGPISLTTVLYPIGASRPAELAQKVRLTLGASLVIAVAASLGIFVTANFVLALFGETYVEQAVWCLRILALGVFPIMIKEHFIAIQRIHNRISQAMLPVVAGAVLEIVMATIGVALYGLIGLAVAWVLALCVEAVLMGRTVYRTTQLPHDPQSSQPQQYESGQVIISAQAKH
jgi:O-antigen/teichoic acid export membrane protein